VKVMARGALYPEQYASGWPILHPWLLVLHVPIAPCYMGKSALKNT
jgi:hypothetical protein